MVKGKVYKLNLRINTVYHGGNLIYRIQMSESFTGLQKLHFSALEMLRNLFKKGKHLLANRNLN